MQMRRPCYEAASGHEQSCRCTSGRPIAIVCFHLECRMSRHAQSHTLPASSAGYAVAPPPL